MAVYRVEMVRSPGVTEAERGARIKRAFDLLLSLGSKEIAVSESLSRDTLTAEAAPAKGQAHLGVYTEGGKSASYN